MERNIGNRNPSVPICISVGSGQFCAKPRWKLLGAVSGHTKSSYNPQHDQKWFAYATIPYWRLPKKKSGDIPSTQTGGTGTYKMYGPKV
jgi:hypothetical protein